MPCAHTAPLGDLDGGVGLGEHSMLHDNVLGINTEKIFMTSPTYSEVWSKLNDLEMCISKIRVDTEKISMESNESNGKCKKVELSLCELIPLPGPESIETIGMPTFEQSECSKPNYKDSNEECRPCTSNLELFESSMRDFISAGFDEHPSLVDEDYVCLGFYESCMYAWMDILGELAEFKKPSFIHEVYEVFE